MKFTKEKFKKSITELLVHDRFSCQLGVSIIRKTAEVFMK